MLDIEVRLWLGHITWVLTQAKVEEDVLNASAVIAKQVLKKGDCSFKTINHLGQNKTVKILAP